MGAKCVIHSHFVRWASQSWHTLQWVYTLFAQTIVRYAHFEANVTKSLETSIRSGWVTLLRAPYGSRICDTFAHSEVCVSKLIYLTLFPIALCQNHCKVCSFWSECYKIIVKYNTKWVSTSTAHPLWEPNVWYLPTFWGEHHKIDAPYSVPTSCVPESL